jgi:hypothetical protein
MFDHSVENREDFAHRRDERDLGRFAGGAQPLIEGANDRVVPRGDERGHVEAVADGAPAASDRAGAAVLAAVAIEGRHADEAGDLLSGQAPEFGQGGQEQARRRAPDTGDT